VRRPARLPEQTDFNKENKMTDMPEGLRAPQFLIGGAWRDGNGETLAEIRNPASGVLLASYRSASAADVEEALAAAGRAFPLWRATPAFERARILRQAAALMRTRASLIAHTLTLEQGKPLAEAHGEVQVTAEMFEWYADEGVRVYGRQVPARGADMRHDVVREPVGPVAALATWNFPARNPGYKIAAALAAGCSCIIKPAEETPLTCLLLVDALLDAGLPREVLGVVYGDAAALSAQLIASPVIRKISYTGSTRIGRLLARQAADGVKKLTLELGGQAPVLVFDDADVAQAVSLTLAAKFRNAGQTCISPTRFFVQEAVYGQFVEQFSAASAALRVGDGLAQATQMGPVLHARRVGEMAAFVQDAAEHGARIECGGGPLGGAGYFFAPTVISAVPQGARLMRDEPFGPIAAITPFARFDEGVRLANSVPYGLAAYAFTQSLRSANKVGAALEAGMVAINTCKVASVETPFGGMKDSGYGSEGGTEGLDAYLVTKSITTAY
jgi:succinate-semialdehyde dehydrogenase/glutarate-semialdehyde dehydrogenase